MFGIVLVEARERFIQQLNQAVTTLLFDKANSCRVYPSEARGTETFLFSDFLKMLLKAFLNGFKYIPAKFRCSSKWPPMPIFSDFTVDESISVPNKRSQTANAEPRFTPKCLG